MGTKATRIGAPGPYPRVALVVLRLERELSAEHPDGCSQQKPTATGPFDAQAKNETVKEMTRSLGIVAGPAPFPSSNAPGRRALHIDRIRR
jgi:hypothetical protein